MTDPRYNETCRSCQAIQGLISLTNTPRILETQHWVVEHIHPTSVRGWLVIVLNRHCEALHQLTADEFTTLSQLLQFVTQALHESLKTDKEYVMQFAEGEGFHHVHFHVVARTSDWPATLKGPHVFAGSGPRVENPLSSEVLTPLALEIREYLLARLPSSE